MNSLVFRILCGMCGTRKYVIKEIGEFVFRRCPTCDYSV